MRILNLQVNKTQGLRIVERDSGDIDFVLFEIDGHYVTPLPGVPETLLFTIEQNHRLVVAELIRP